MDKQVYFQVEYAGEQIVLEDADKAAQFIRDEIDNWLPDMTDDKLATTLDFTVSCIRMSADEFKSLKPFDLYD